jgi:membrane associated rhomboid family serine protease
MLKVLDPGRRAAAPTGAWPSTSLALILVTTAVFVLQNIADGLNQFALYPEFALSLDGLRHGRVWQLLTFQFLHLPLAGGGAFHLLGNLFVLYVFGGALEKTIGRAALLKLYLLSGTMGGLLQMAGGLLAPERFGVAVVGASAGAFGLVAALATLAPERRMHLFFLPMPVRADLLLTLGVAATLAGLFLPSGHVAHCAHLGGILTGFLFARRWVRQNRAPAVFRLAAKCSLEIKPLAD